MRHPTRHKNNSVACFECRKKKQKCVGGDENTSCVSCAKTNTKCQIDASTDGRRGWHRKVEESRRKQRLLENLLDTIRFSHASRVNDLLAVIRSGATHEAVQGFVNDSLAMQQSPFVEEAESSTSRSANDQPSRCQTESRHSLYNAERRPDFQASAAPWIGQSPSELGLPFAPPSATPSDAETRNDNRHAQVGSDHDSRLSCNLIPMRERAEKDKMVKGCLFKFVDPRLHDERARCREALWRLNNAGNPQYGIGVSEKVRLLQDVLNGAQLLHQGYVGAVPMEKPEGSLGLNAHVELPFKCHYGYNIHIGEDAYIGENCTIIDACKVSIGRKTWIGANVTILTAMAHTDLQHRQGANSSWQGKEVVIEEDVYIGANVMICPGIKLARGAFIEPGSIVKQDLPQYWYLGYKPSYLSRRKNCTSLTERTDTCDGS